MWTINSLITQSALMHLPLRHTYSTEPVAIHREHQWMEAHGYKRSARSPECSFTDIFMDVM